ncbi:hypothetical protein F4861DRAFT_462931 [Xylaria intraflava]|nr:hypothetical protein F4861DRAFT_462931 [Xylaria intraflava]
MTLTSEANSILPRKGDDAGWLAYLAAAKATDPDFENGYGTEHLAADYAALPIKLAKAMKHATGYESEELFRIGYMLLIVQEHQAYTLDNLAQVTSTNWVMPTDDLDLIDRVRDIMSLPCNFAKELSQSNFRHLAEHVDDPREVQSFLGRLASVKLHSGGLPQSVLSVLEIKAIICAEIWCTWANEDRSPLPSTKSFIGLFGPGVESEVIAFVTRLQQAFTCKEVRDFILQRYGYDVVFLRKTNDLVDLVDGPL